MVEIKRNSTTLARARQRAGLEQADAARKLRVSVEHVSRVERGHSGVSDQLAIKMAALYRVSRRKVLRWNRRAKNQQLRLASKRLRGGRDGSRAA